MDPDRAPFQSLEGRLDHNRNPIHPIEGDVPNLPYIETEPARPAFIRNCTRHELVVRPDGVKLLAQDDEPYNEEQFNVGVYQVYDLENPQNKPIKEVNLSEGETVEIQFDWTGEKTKCQ